MASIATQPQTRTPAPTRKVRVLVADDSSSAREAIVSYLRTLAHVEVDAVCENGHVAVEAALRREPDVALLDLQMPVMNGLEAAEIFRTSMPHVGVIVTSMQDSIEVRDICVAGGVDAFIGKPMLPDHFARVLPAVLERTRAPERHRRGAVAVSVDPLTTGRSQTARTPMPARTQPSVRSHAAVYPLARDKRAADIPRP